MLRYLHKDPNKLRGILLVAFGLILSNMVRYFGYADGDPNADFKTGCYRSLLQLLPYIVDGVFYGVIDKWRSVLLFPLCISSFEFLFTLNDTSAAMSYMAYALFDNLILTQMMSLFGCFGLSFMIALFSSVLDYAIDVFKTEHKFSKWVFGYIIAVLFFAFYGCIQLRVEPDNKKVKVVSASGMSQLEYNLGYQDIREDLTDFYNDIEEKAQLTESLGGKLLTFAEEGFYIYYLQKDSFIENVGEIAKNHDIYILLSLDIYEEDMINYNSHALINNKGELLYYYIKHHPIKGVEEGYIKGKDKIKTFHTEFGKITSVICYDLDFTMFMNWVGFHHPDIVIAPSWDYSGVHEIHTKQTKFKAIENGFNIIKNTFDGVQLAVDFNGRVLGYHKTHGMENFVVVADVYTKGRKTLYSFIGIFLNYFYIIGIFLVIFIKSKMQWKIYKDYAEGNDSETQQLQDKNLNDKQEIKAQEIEVQPVTS